MPARSAPRKGPRRCTCFDSMEAIGAAFASPPGQAAAADLANFAQAGVEMQMYDTKMV